MFSRPVVNYDVWYESFLNGSICLRHGSVKRREREIMAPNTVPPKILPMRIDLMDNGTKRKHSKAQFSLRAF